MVIEKGPLGTMGQLARVGLHQSICQDLLCFGISVEQKFWKPHRYVGKGLEGRGQGTEWLTSHKLLPMSMGKGIPLLLQAR